MAEDITRNEMCLSGDGEDLCPGILDVGMTSGRDSE